MTLFARIEHSLQVFLIVSEQNIRGSVGTSGTVKRSVQIVLI